MKLRLPALNFRANLLPLFLRTRRIPILPTMLLLICLIAMTGRSFAAQLELDLLKDPGGLANAIHVWEFQADGSQVQQMTGGNTFSNATDGLTGSLEGAAGFFTVTISSVDNFDEVNFTNTLSDISGDKWAYNSAEANYGTKTPTDPLIQIQPGEAMLMTFDLSNLTLPSGKQLYVNGFKVQNGFTNSPGGQRISYLENGATNAVQLTGDSGEQNALVGGDDVIQPVGQSVDTGDQIAIWATSNFGQKRFVGFRFSVRQTVVLNTDDSGPGSLRQVLIDATSGDTITFDSALSGSTILLTSGQILIDKNIDIDASAVAGGISIDGNANGRIFEITAGTTSLFENLTLTNGLASGTAPNNYGGGILVKSGAVLTINSSTLSGNTAAFGGGILSSGMLTVNHSTLSSNTAVSSCGGIYNLEGTLIVNHSTLSGNTADALGGGIRNYNATGSVSINHSTLSGNKANTSRGGGIYNNGTLTLNSSTLSENTAYTYGGGIFNTSIGTLTLQNSTLSANTADDIGGGIRNNGGTLNSTNSIVADNMAPTGTNVYGSINSDVNNLTSGDPQLAPLGDYGGPTQTMPPLPGSPAIDAGLTSATNSLTDQRGLARVVGSAVDMGAVESGHAIPVVDYTVVTSTNDFLNGLDLNGVSLRDAIAFATNGTTITFDSALSGSTILLTSGQILIDKNLDIDASALAGGITIDGNGLGDSYSTRIFEITAGTTNVFDSLTLINGGRRYAFEVDAGGAIYVNSGAHLTLTGSTLSGNSAIEGGGIANYNGTITLNHSTLTDNLGGFGGGIYNGGGTITLNHSMLSGNAGSWYYRNSSGGGIYNEGGTITLNHSTLSGNYALYEGGGIYNFTNSTLTLHNSTLSGNTAVTGGGIRNYGTLTLHNSTLSGNTVDGSSGGGIANSYNGTLTLHNSTLSGNTATYSGGGIYNYNGGTLNSTNTIIAGNTASTDDNIAGISISSGVNNLTSGDPLLAPLGDYGGPTQTMPPLPGSPAIDAGGTTTNTTDQRGLTREVNAAVDIGAVEIQGASDTDSIIAAAWSTDADSDGNAFGVEFALGTDWNTSDGTNTANLAALSAGGAAFGFNPAAVPNTAWVLKRSLDLVTDPFVEIYRYDGPTDTTTTNLQVSITTTAFGIEVQDQSGATNAFYQFEAEVSP